MQAFYSNLKLGTPRSCGCANLEAKILHLHDIVGKKFGHLQVESLTKRQEINKYRKFGFPQYICQCDCGSKPCVVPRPYLLDGKGQSCGCRHSRYGGNLPVYRDFAKEHSLEYQMWVNARIRAKNFGWAFDITPSDIIIPIKCPLLDLTLSIKLSNRDIARSKPPGLKRTGEKRARHSTDPNAPSLDRIDSSKGYTKDNVWVISWRANTLKNNASLPELKLLTYNLGLKILNV